ncbi:MAG: type IV secretion system DNA-binding domain-containing protein [Caldilineales bacterium]|nr:type IV secretion system DNA-binding domain-containing protein [Caldilineales bacterium]
MTNTPDLTPGKLHVLEWGIVLAVLYSPYFLLFGPIAGLSGYVFEKRVPGHIARRRTLIGLYILSFLWFLWVVHAIIAQGFDPTRFLQYSLWQIPSFAFASLAYKALAVGAEFIRPKTLSEQLQDLVERQLQQEQRLTRKAGQRRERKPVRGMIRIGAKVKGDSFAGVTCVDEGKGWFMLDEKALDEHVFVLGATGAGKTETLKKLLYEVLHHTERDVIFVDGKGDAKLANDVRGLAYAARGVKAPIFRLGMAAQGAIYDGFRGQPADIYNRLCALIGVDEVEGDALFYADVNRDLLQLVCYAPGGPPRSFEELRQRIDRDWLLNAYQGDLLELADIEALSAKQLEGLLYRIRPLAREFSGVIGDEGFAIEHAQCAIFSLRTQSVGDTARRLIDFLVEDLKDYIGKRQRQPALLLIDEFGQFRNESILALLSMARSARFGVIIATQDVASLKDERIKKLILANTRTKILMGTDFPEDVAQLAGTIYQLEASLQHQEGDPTGLGSARIQHAFKVDMNEAGRLEAGDAFVIRQRRAAKVKVKPIAAVRHIEPQLAETRQMKTPTTRYQPAHANRLPPRI